VSLQIHPEARTEYREAVLFYGTAAERFVDAVDAALSAILRNPERFRELSPGIRTCRVSRFPYSILYRYSQETGVTVILAIKHDRRHPDYWRERR
jgi:plasmid stabilization system protein ParE